MSAVPHLHPAVVTEVAPVSGGPLAGRARIGRQSIHDRTGAVVGHELLFRGVDGRSSTVGPTPGGTAGVPRPSATSGELATSQVIAATFGDFGIDRLGGGHPLFLNVTRAFLVGDLPLPFGPEGVVLEVLEDIEVDDRLVEAVTALRAGGYRFAVDDFTGEAERERLLPLCDVVKIDVLGVAAEDLAEVVRRCRDAAPGVQVLAERVEDEDSLARCVAAGADLFQGYHFQRPAVLETVRMSPSQTVSLQLLAALGRPDTPAAELEQIVSADPGLVLRILRTANSAASGSRRSITSLRQALVLLGPASLRAWVMLTLMGGLAAGRRDDLLLVLSRAAACDVVAGWTGADRSAAYTAGMLSGIAQVLRTGLDQVCFGAGLDEDLTRDLVFGVGPVGTVLQAVLAHEVDDQGAPALAGLSWMDLSRAALLGWSTALETTERTLG